MRIRVKRGGPVRLFFEAVRGGMKVMLCKGSGGGSGIRFSN